MSDVQVPACSRCGAAIPEDRSRCAKCGEQASHRGTIQFRHVLLISAAISVLLALPILITAKNRNRSLEREVLRVEAEVARHSATVRDVEAFERNRETLERMISLINASTRDRLAAEAVFCLSSLQDQSDLEISGVKAAGDHLFIKGTWAAASAARSPSEIDRLLGEHGFGRIAAEESTSDDQVTLVYARREAE